MSGDSSGDVPRQIGPYRIESRLGAGGMGEVYRGFDERLRRPVALKRVRVENAADEDETTRRRQRLRREARAAAGVAHSAIVQIFDWVEEENGDWFVMELIDGRSLRQILQDGPLPSDKAVLVATQIAAGLDAAHHAGLIHRDLKPENVMITHSGEVKILDFGLVKEMQPEDSVDDTNQFSISVVGQVVGTVTAMSPEQAMGHELDARSDLFSLGTLLYEMLAGEMPFQGSGMVEILTKICTQDPLPIQHRVPGIPAALSDLVGQLMSKDPEERPQTAKETFRRFEELTHHFSGAKTPRLVESGVSTIFDRPNESSGIDLQMDTKATTYSVATVFDSQSNYSGSYGSSRMAVMKTLLLSDLVDSTKMVEQLGDARAAELFEIHDRIARDLLGRHEGREIDKSDGFLMLFDRPINAVLYALDYHAALQEISQQTSTALRSRVGIHVGEVVLRENSSADIARGAKPIEVEGLAKAMAARLMSIAIGGQTLVSRGIFDLGRRASVGIDGLPDTLRWLKHGPYLLKGVEEPVDIFEVGIEGVAPLRRPPDSEKVQHAESESLRRVRRGGIVAAVLALLVIASFFFVNRSGDSSISAEDVRPAVAVVGFQNLTGREDVAWVSTALTELLTADLAADGELRLTPGETVERMKRELGLSEVRSFSAETLVAVRENLGVQWVIVGSYLAAEGTLTVTPVLQKTSAEGSVESMAPRQGSEVDLYALIAQTGADLRGKIGVGDASLSTSQTQAVQATLSSDQGALRDYYEGLRQMREFDFPGARESLERAIDQDPEYALAHAALSRTWFELGFDQRSQESARRAFELRESLPIADAKKIEGMYYRAVDQIDDALEVYSSLVSEYPDELEYGLLLTSALATTGRHNEALEKLAELAKLPAAVSDDPQLSLLEANVLFDAGNYERAVEVSERVVEQAGQKQAKSLAAQAKLRAGRSYAALGRAEAEPAYQESLKLFRSVGDPVREAVVLNAIGVLQESRGELHEAESAYEQAQIIFEPLGARAWVATTSYNLAFLADLRGDLADARVQAEESLRLVREIGDRDREARRVWFLGVVALKQGRFDEAAEASAQALQKHTDNGNQRGIARAMLLSARLAYLADDLDAAAARLDEAFGVIEKIGRLDLHDEASILRAQIFLAQGRLEEASESLLRAREMHDDDTEERNVRPLRRMEAEILLERGEYAEAEIEAASLRAAFAAQDLRDDVLLTDALRVRARSLRGGGSASEASELREAAQDVENPEVRLKAELAAAQVLGDAGALSAIRSEAQERGYLRIAAEAIPLD